MSSSSVVCQALQPCLEPRRFVDPRLPLLEMTPWVSGLRQPPFPADPLPEINAADDAMEQQACGGDDKAEAMPNAETGGWSFLQSIVSKTDANSVYAHRPVSSASAKLSKRSLEMCTEGLGSETGNIAIKNSEEISLLSAETCFEREGLKRGEGKKAWKGKGWRRAAARFPPPIRSMSSSGGGVRVKPWREGGRLVLEAVSVSSSVSCFRVERSEGRLRLCLQRDSRSDSEEETEKMLRGKRGRKSYQG